MHAVHPALHQLSFLPLHPTQQAFPVTPEVEKALGITGVQQLQCMPLPP